MIDFDETELIEFFNSLPVDQDEDREFFGSSTFVANMGDDKLTFSISPNFSDIVLQLSKKEFSQQIVWEHHILDPKAVSIEAERNGRSWLDIYTKSELLVSISLIPTIWVSVKSGKGKGME